MPFIPDTTFGIIYALSCFGVAGFAHWRNNPHAKIVALIFVAHWFIMRGIDVIDHGNPWLWVPHSLATVVALGLYGRRSQSELAFACAILMAVCMAFDQFWLVQYVTGIRFSTINGGFEQNGAVAEGIGYLCFAMIAGSTIGHSGMGSRRSPGDWVDRPRRLHLRQAAQVGRAISARPAMPRGPVARDQFQEKEDGGPR